MVNTNISATINLNTVKNFVINKVVFAMTKTLRTWFIKTPQKFKYILN